MHPTYTPFHSRSAIPRVIGILAIVFSVIGFGLSIIFSFGPIESITRRSSMMQQSGFVLDWLYLWGALSFLLFVVHLVGGILATSYRPLGLRLLTGYAVGALVLVVMDLVILYGYGKGHRFHENVTFPRTMFSVIAVVWPIVVLALVNLRRTKAACATS